MWVPNGGGGVIKPSSPGGSSCQKSPSRIIFKPPNARMQPCPSTLYVPADGVNSLHRCSTLHSNLALTILISSTISHRRLAWRALTSKRKLITNTKVIEFSHIKPNAPGHVCPNWNPLGRWGDRACGGSVIFAQCNAKVTVKITLELPNQCHDHQTQVHHIWTRCVSKASWNACEVGYSCW